jgi:coenzyme F420-reducing hydrogenase gamma subunit
VNSEFVRRFQEILTVGYSIFGCPPTDEAFLWIKLGKSTNENFHLQITYMIQLEYRPAFAV